MQQLRPCVACSRHVLASATRCPFCASDLDVAFAAPVVPSARIGRAARMALGAAVVTTASFVACGGDITPPGGGNDASADGNGSGDGSTNADGSLHVDASADVAVFPDANDENIAKPYGAPPADGLRRTVV